jgi:hypothetical protein
MSNKANTAPQLSLTVGGNALSTSFKVPMFPPISASIKTIKDTCRSSSHIPPQNQSSVFGVKTEPEFYSPSTPSTPSSMKRKPVSMSRAKCWSLEVENSFRFQEAGFSDIEEYVASGNESPEIWPSGFVKCLKSKKTGFFLYFRAHRECQDKHLNKVKIYSY